MISSARYSFSINIAGTTTFRASSAKLLKDVGNNSQNWSKDLRRIFIPDAGKILGQTDQAGAEALIVAYLCRAGRYRELFTNKVKPHTFIAMHVFKDKFEKRLGFSIDNCITCKIPELKNQPNWAQLSDMIKESDNWPANERYYYIGKKIVHASSYGMEAFTFAQSVLDETDGAIRLTEKEADAYLKTFHTLFPEIRAWHVNIIDDLNIKKRRLSNLFGYQRYFGGHWGKELFKEAYAFVPQSTVGCITHIAITELQERIDNGDKILKDIHFDILMNGHDSIQWQCDVGGEHIAKAEVSKHLNRELRNNRNEVFYMKSETNVGYNLTPYKQETNPKGLVEI